ncbi:hypothetical protein H6F43_02180 [Leptolyngbya sp. FACHB-36]|uniref:hypothetical protein n=1 Tax=Leptolyngbya sp. FACHB-36 TaxID=2692808 RepID=UPI001681C136|nr:hypothetical protein [Leptolyngbya sp. FACHB-36]MBD2018994.1 hypothetical protein [Leptolyngbya sp. FACHB-36]
MAVTILRSLPKKLKKLLLNQLQARLPKGRDLTGEEFLKTLELVTQQLSKTVA